VSDKASSRQDRARRVDRMIGRRLRRARTLNGIELRELAEALGVSVKMAEQFEAGQRRIDPVLLVRAVTYLQVSLADVFRNDKEPKTLRSRRRTSR
jgi:transcriptional regulator with XRE-family HTH domain